MTRSGTRVSCDIPVTLRSLAITAESSVIVLANPQGCAARCNHPLKIGTSIQIEGLPLNRSIAATVVNCIHLGKHEKFWLLGLSLMEPGNVWGIVDVPEDWEQHRMKKRAAGHKPG